MRTGWIVALALMVVAAEHAPERMSQLMGRRLVVSLSYPDHRKMGAMLAYDARASGGCIALGAISATLNGQPMTEREGGMPGQGDCAWPSFHAVPPSDLSRVAVTVSDASATVRVEISHAGGDDVGITRCDGASQCLVFSATGRSVSASGKD